MEKVTRFKTRDGKEHASEKAAREHCENMAGEILGRHAHKIAHLTKWVEIVAYLGANLPSFVTAAEWRADMDQQTDDDE